MKRTRWIGAGLGFLLGAIWLAPSEDLATGHLLGPLAPIAAQVQWVRGHAARLAGDQGRAFLLMESAVRFEPRSTTAWITLSNQLGLQLASSESGRSPEERAEWLRAACSVLKQGETYARHPEGLALHRGLLLVSHAETDPNLAWEGGILGLWSQATEAFERAQKLAGRNNVNGTIAAALDYARAMATGLEDGLPVQ